LPIWLRRKTRGIRMSRKMFVLLFTLIVGAISSPAITTAQPASNPYIFYFSHGLKAFVIERADGSESRTLGEGVLKLTSEYASSFVINGPGWSPSGEWLAWSAGEGASYAVVETKPYLINADGSVLMTFGNLRNPVMQWSPRKDLLLIAGQWEEHYFHHTTVLLVDPANNRRIVIRPDTLVLGAGSIIMEWLNDEQAVVLISRGISNDTTKYSLYLIDANGAVIERNMENLMSGISPDGYVAYRLGGTPIIENVWTGERLPIDNYILSQTTGVAWSPYGEYAILFASGMIHWDVKQNKLTPVNLLPGVAADEAVFSVKEWFPDNDHILFNTDRALYLASVESGSFQRVGQQSENFPGEPLSEVSIDGQLYAIQENYIDPYLRWLYQYDTATRQSRWVTLPPETGQLYWEFRVSPDGKSLSWIGDGPVIADLHTAKARLISPSSHAWNTFSHGVSRWSPDSEWLMTFDYAVVAGGGPYFFVSIVRRDGTMRRDLTFAYGIAANYYGFLPTQVNTRHLPLPKTRQKLGWPARTLNNLGWVTHIVWSPDGSQIAAGLQGLYGVHVDARLWDVKTGDSAGVRLGTKSASCIGWKREPGSTDFYAYSLSETKSCARAVSPNGSQYITVSDGNIAVFNTELGRITHNLSPAIDYFAPVVSYSRTRNLAAIADYRAPIRIYDTTGWYLLREISPSPRTGKPSRRATAGTSTSGKLPIWLRHKGN
jgi:WD40 repeat protein